MMTVDLTPDQKNEFKFFFDMIDRNGDKKITFEEFRKAMRKDGVQASDEKLMEVFMQTDLNGDGEIDPNEFLESIRRLIESGQNIYDAETEADYRETFESIDKDGDGYITSAELKSFMDERGEKTNKEEIDSLMQDGDLDGDKQINFIEFCELIESS